jgi:hypothetical protein
LREGGVIAIATEVIPCAEERTAEMTRGKAGKFKGRFTGEVGFLHGTCGTLAWQEVAATSQAEGRPREIPALEIERLASKLVEADRKSAGVLCNLLRGSEPHSVERLLAAALERALEQTTCNGFDSDGLDIFDLRRATI